MKQIKFRGKDINGHYVYGLLTKKKNRNTNKLSYAIARGDFSQAETIPVAENSVAQFIGYDTNGKEIYADDFILETPFPDAVPQKYLAGDRIAANRFGEKFDNVELKESQDEEER